MRSLVLTTLVCLMTVPAFASRAKSDGSTVGFVKITPKRELYVNYQPPAPGQPTLVLLNGLTYSTTNWDKFAAFFKDSGIGILRYDMQGQGQTLLRYAPALAPYPQQDQVDDLPLLLQALNITTPVHLLGFSYGGGIALMFAAQHSNMIASLILMTPYVAPLVVQDQWILEQIANTRIMFPFNPATDDELYDYFLKSLVYTTYPQAEPSLLDNPYKLEATFRLVQGARKFLAWKLVEQLPAGKVHLIMGSKDEWIDNSVHEQFWLELPQADRMSQIIIQDAPHKMPEACPNFAADWVKHIVQGDANLVGDTHFIGNTSEGTATAGNLVISNLGKK